MYWLYLSYLYSPIYLQTPERQATVVVVIRGLTNAIPATRPIPTLRPLADSQTAAGLSQVGDMRRTVWGAQRVLQVPLRRRPVNRMAAPQYVTTACAWVWTLLEGRQPQLHISGNQFMTAHHFPFRATQTDVAYIDAIAAALRVPGVCPTRADAVRYALATTAERVAADTAPTVGAGQR